MQFFCIRNEAIRQTHRALQTLSEQRQGSLRPGRVLRVAQLYGYLQWRSRGSRDVRVTLRDLGAAWFVQPRLLKADLDDLQALGWLRFASDAKGTTVTLTPSADGSSSTTDPAGEPLDGGEADDIEARHEPLLAATQDQLEAIASENGSQSSAPQPVITTRSPEPSAEHERNRTPAMSQLISAFAEVYNQHKPQSWPAYKPTGAVLANRLRQAIRQAGGAEAFEAVLTQALRGMPEFWRITYPEGRSGAECASALLKVDRASEGRGVEHWHLFSWAALAQRHCSGNGGNTAAVGQDRPATMRHPEHRRACKLLAWDGHAWKGKGMEAARLPANELQRLAEILEGAGFGKPGTAAEQFAQEEEARR